MEAPQVPHQATILISLVNLINLMDFNKNIKILVL